MIGNFFLKKPINNNDSFEIYICQFVNKQNKAYFTQFSSVPYFMEISKEPWHAPGLIDIDMNVQNKSASFVVDTHVKAPTLEELRLTTSLAELKQKQIIG